MQKVKTGFSKPQKKDNYSLSIPSNPDSRSRSGRLINFVFDTYLMKCACYAPL